MAGLGAGTINAVVGSGTLITFPTLLAIGMPPVLANVSNSVGVVAGGLSSIVGYRRELAGQRSRVLAFAPLSLLGAVAGALLLLRLPPGAFNAIVPVLILIGCALVVVQPWVRTWVLRREAPPTHHLWVKLAVLGTGAYGGYFGAAQGVLLMAILGIGVSVPNDQGDLQKMNGLKNVLSTVANLVASVVFVLVTDVDWAVAGLIAAGSLVGGHLGAKVGRRLPPLVLRIVIVVVGLSAVVMLLVRS